MGSRGGEARGPSWRGRIKGVEGVRGYFTALEGLVGLGISAVMLLYHTLQLLGLSLANICVYTRRYVGIHT